MTAHSRARVASDALTLALVNAATQGVKPRCADPETHTYWLSEHPGDRAQAVRWCRGCPVLEPCGEAAQANNERFGVWAGKDRTRHPGRKAEAA